MKAFAFALALLVCAAFSAPAADRVALVIGNGSYHAPLQKLEACPRDAAKMAAAFQKIGIRVYSGKPLIDLNADQMDTALNDFVHSLGKDSEAFIYYSGHGAQIGGSNYLLPVGFNARYESQARRQAVSLDAILELMEKSESKLRVVILDSCRDPGEFLPGEPAFKGPAHSKGLNDQKVEIPETLVCFATKHGTAALADDTASYYTRVLADEIVKPGKVEDVLKIVARRVYADTNGKQLPFTYGSLLQDHFFAPIPSPFPPPGPVAAATKDAPYVNSLRQEFVPVPGTKVLFCRWDTRVSDWQAFIQEEGDAEQWGIYGLDEKEVKWALKKDLSWKNPGFAQTGEHPVVGVSWEDAHRFCAWLSKKEGRTYRLPTDAEWSSAVGSQKYPWGDEFPPPKGSGNYGDKTYLKSLAGNFTNELADYDDGYARTSPVGSFAANRYGLYDMSGNVRQWCEDQYKSSMNSAEAIKKYPDLKDERASDGTPYRVLRGGSWNYNDPLDLRSTYRNFDLPGGRLDDLGFRCVLVVSGG